MNAVALALRTGAACWAALLLSLAPETARAQSMEFGYPYVATGGFAAPCGVAFEPSSDRVLVADTANHRVRYTSVASLEATPPWTELGHETDPAAPGALGFPQGVAADAEGNVYAIDTVGGEVQLFRPDGAGGYVLDPAFTAATPRGSEVRSYSARRLATRSKVATSAA